MKDGNLLRSLVISHRSLSDEGASARSLNKVMDQIQEEGRRLADTTEGRKLLVQMASDLDPWVRLHSAVIISGWNEALAAQMLEAMLPRGVSPIRPMTMKAALSMPSLVQRHAALYLMNIEQGNS